MEDEDVSIESDGDDLNEKISLNFFHNKTVDNITKKISASVINNTKERLNTTDADIGNIKANLIKIDNIDNLIEIEKIYSLILENNYEKNSYSAIIEDWFMIIVKNNEIYELIEIYTEKQIRKSLKLSFIYEISGFALLYLYSLLKAKNKELENAFKTFFFYLHQNYIVNLFLINKNFKLESKDINAILSENKTWMNKSNNLKCLMNNNKMLKTIIKNIIINFKNLQIEEFSSLFSILINYIKNSRNFKISIIKDTIFKRVYI
jgi:hypothetical protein